MARFVWWIGICLGLAVALSGCGEKGPILVGAVGDLQSGGKDVSSSFRNGVALAEEMFNETGGVGGDLIKVIFGDDEGDPMLVPKVDEKLIASGVKALIGHNTSATTEAALPVIARHKILLIGPEATSSQFAGKDDYYVRVEVVEKTMAEILADYASKTMKLRSVGAMLDEKNRPFCRPFFDAFQKRFRSLGGEAEIMYAYTNLDTVEAGRQTDAFLRRKGQALLLITNGEDTRLLGREVRKVRNDLPLLGTTWAIPPSMTGVIGPLPEGLIFPCTWDPDSQAPAYLEFKNLYEKRFSQPIDYHAVHAYEAMGLLVQAIKKGGRDRTKLGSTVSKMGDFDGLQGRIRIDAYGDCQRDVYMLRAIDGEPRRVDAQPRKAEPQANK